MCPHLRAPLFTISLIAVVVCAGAWACPKGDINGDCWVDLRDMGILADQWLGQAGVPADLVNNDGVDLADFAELAEDWHKPVVVINEIHSDPDIKTQLVEFVELYNTSPVDVNIAGWYFSDGITYKFGAGARIPAKGCVIVVENLSHIASKWGSSRNWKPECVYGPYVGNLSADGERIRLCDADGEDVDEVTYGLGFPWPTVGDPVPYSATPNGTGQSMQLMNPYVDNDLGGSWRSASPTPLSTNAAVYASNPPPCVRQVKHSPKQPKMGEVVTITAKITDASGIGNVMLYYQVVDPGRYISLTGGEYYGGWITLNMRDDGTGGDAAADDDVYTVQIPGSVQVHRRLIRYKMTVMDAGTPTGVTFAPYQDDPQPNFAYFVYDGVPAWRGANRPGVTPVVTYGPEVMNNLPVYHLISKKSDVETATWLEKYGGDEDKWLGTLVYDGEVYDHIRYRMRGGVWRYAMGKNMFKFNLNRGHYFQACDDYGEQYKTKWGNLNFSACIQQGSFGQRGEQGLFEAVSFRMFNLAGVPASKTNYVHFRIIDETYEDGAMNAAHPPLTSSGTQYDGDFWGLYMTIEQVDGRFLDEHRLPDGNLYKMDSQVGDALNNQGPTQPSNGSDLSQYKAGGGSEQWWRQNVNLDCYYGYYAVYQAIHHGDITGKNWFLYHCPESTINQWGTNYLWWQLPWDLDLTWTTYYGSDYPSDDFSRRGVLNYAVISTENKNRIREVCDLLFNSDQTNQLIDEYAAIIWNPSGLSFVDADRAMWDYHWVVGDGAYPTYLNQPASNKAGQGRFYQAAATKDFPGMVKLMKDYVVARLTHMNSISSDTAIPNTPVIQYTGTPDYPANGLMFETSAFSDPQGNNTFGGMKWRIAEVTPWSVPPVPSNGTILINEGMSWKYFKGTEEPSATTGAWRQIDFPEAGWIEGGLPIGYGESFIVTRLDDMRYKYSTVYLRKKFEVTNLAAIGKLFVEVKYDDGFNVWINGTRVAWDNVAGENLKYTDIAQTNKEVQTFTRFALPDPKTYLVSGTNVIAVQLLNMHRDNSGDCFIDLKLIAEAGGSGGGGSGTPPSYGRIPGKYEIEAAWESEELTSFQDTVRIPANVARPGHTYRVRCRMKDNTGRWSRWSGPVQLVAGEPMSAGIVENLRITEVMYNPPQPPAGVYFNNDEFEFVELKNVGDEVLDLTYVSFIDGITFAFGGSAIKTLGPGEFVLVVKNKPAFESRYGTSVSNRIAGIYPNNLSNGGEQIILVDMWNGTIADFEYGDGRGWPGAADGAGHSLVPLASALPGEPDGSLTYPGNWRASAHIYGSPGRDDPELGATVVVNEIMAHTDYLNPLLPLYDSNDWIELYNASDRSVNLSNWYLSDDKGDLKKWAIPAINLGAGARVVFDEVSGFHSPITIGFGLNKAGEEVILSYLPGTAEDRIVDYVSFKGQENDVSLGRYPDGGDWWFAMSMSRAKANLNPVSDIIISEIMYHPIDPNEEYIELYNPTTKSILLANASGTWRLDSAVSFSLPAGIWMNPGKRLIVVGFDPKTEPQRLSAFIAAYQTGALAAGTDIIGPWAGNLSNAGERIAIERPQAPDVAGDPISWVIVDEVIYSDGSPWPMGADGDGKALHRIHSDQYHSGNDPANWGSAAPSPGK